MTQTTFLRKNLPYLALATAIISQTLSPFFVRWGGADVPGTVFAFYRLTIGGLLITIPFIMTKPQMRRWTKIDLFFPILGGLCTAVDLSFWNESLQITSIANATLMSNTAPVWVVLFSLFLLKERLPRSFWIGFALTLIGAAVVLSYDFFLRPHLSQGDLLALTSALFYGGYYLSTQQGRKRLSVIHYLWIMSAAASFFLLIFCLVLGHPLSGYGVQTVLSFIGAGVVVQCIAYVAVAFALGHLPASIVSPTIILQPVLSTLFAIPVFGEKFIPVQWLGMSLVLLGIYLIHRSKEREDPKVQIAPV